MGTQTLSAAKPHPPKAPTPQLSEKRGQEDKVQLQASSRLHFLFFLLPPPTADHNGTQSGQLEFTKAWEDYYKKLGKCPEPSCPTHRFGGVCFTFAF